MFKIENEFDLHRKVVDYIRRFYPDLLFIAGLGELQDTSDKRIKSWQKGYQKGQPDLIITSHHKRYNGFCLEFKTPTGKGVLSEAQDQQLKNTPTTVSKHWSATTTTLLHVKLPTTARALEYLVNIAQRSSRPPTRLTTTSRGFIKYPQNIMISIEEFNDAIKEVEISEWRHLSVGEIYEIVDYVIMESPYGESMKLTVKDQEGALYTVWAPE